jgi:Zn-dependent peptidase ImmA (M78 family)
MPEPAAGLSASSDGCTGLGMRPVPDIVTLLELELGVRVFIRRLDSTISGLFVYDETLGPCVLLNASHPRERRTQTAAGSDRLTRRHVVILAHFFGVSREAMVRRLEELGLTKAGTWDWFQSNGGITDEQAGQVLGDLVAPDQEKADADRPTTLRLNLLAAEAYRQNLLSEGQLARLLGLDRIELRGILDNQESEGIDADGIMPNVLD